MTFLRRYSVFVLIFSAVLLTALGLVMLFSTGAFARDSHGDMYYFVKRQVMWLGVGGVVCAAAASMDYTVWRRFWWVWLLAAVVVLACCFVPGIGMRVNGSNRWVRVGPAAFQASEIAKFAAILFLAWYYEKTERDASHFFKGIILPLAVLAVPLALIALESDLGTTALILGVSLSIMFVAGLGWHWLVPFGIAGVGAVLYMATHVEERMGRLLAFIHPEKYKLTDGLQQWQALIAFGSGGFEGLGLGEGRQKMLYLPYAHTDFIFPMVGEELGLRFTLITVFFYLLIALSGALIAMNARDRFGMFLGVGAVMTLTLQAIVNIGVTTSLLPNKGMPLPFISYGGSNLLMCLFMIGLLVSIHRHGRPVSVPIARFTMARQPARIRS